MQLQACCLLLHPPLRHATYESGARLRSCAAQAPPPCPSPQPSRLTGLPVLPHLPRSQTLAGCVSDPSPPEQGDVRLVPLHGITPTAPCDTVHYGGVEIFNDGQWGRICIGDFGYAVEEFPVEAAVVCRQLGFPYGGLYDVRDPDPSSRFRVEQDTLADTTATHVVWATEVRCTGIEQRLDACLFPEAFGEAGDYEYRGQDGDDGVGIWYSSCSRIDSRMLGVVCRQFPVNGAPFANPAL